MTPSPTAHPSPGALSPRQAAFLAAHQVGHLATADASGQPHVVPVCYALLGQRLYIALDEKPKSTAPRRLKRVRNILANPRAALIVDRYDDDWSKLGYVLVLGAARILESGAEHQRAVRELRRRYSQYRRMALEERPIIAIQVEQAMGWGDLGAGQGPVS